MKDIENLHALKSEIFDIFMHLEVDEHEQRKRRAAVRYLKARRGIEQRAERRRLQQHIAELPD
ncbi:MULTISPECIES: PA3496 family putative envelope integrity protein [Salinicola]|uniref:Uncharacterized protein n=1 Tax=Salinicola endophyticus TaxID=1949083 RepID=A0AB74UDB0_9GAMM|nr:MULTISPECIES: hypothetical protein [unclassified Salinicola]KFF48806.1 hypothetical protein GY26_11910 [Gammaproteobacteria bacterium MFB021]KFF50629.1 hypothetical protein GY26_00795 [Gammaproteobacteria bacterium MFB021]MCE3028010.1 hypothetical protein [Salinicola sp. DM10]WIX32748.1 hypothetical protein QO259_18390 [Salinicola sp. JS01]